MSGVLVPSPRTVDWAPLYNSACGKDPKQWLHRSSSGLSFRSNYDAGLSHEPTEAASDVAFGDVPTSVLDPPLCSCLRAGQQKREESSGSHVRYGIHSEFISFMWHDEQTKLSIISSAKKTVEPREKLDHRRKPQPKFFPFG